MTDVFDEEKQTQSDFFFESEGDEITGDEFAIQEDDQALTEFNPSLMEGWTFAYIKKLKFDKKNVFGTNSKYAGESAPTIEITWECFNSKAKGISINFDRYYAHPATNYALNKLAKALRLEYTEDPTRKNKKTGEPLRIYRYSETKMINRCLLLFVTEGVDRNGEKSGYPVMKKKSGSPFVVSAEEAINGTDNWEQVIMEEKNPPSLPFCTTGTDGEPIMSESTNLADDLPF